MMLGPVAPDPSCSACSSAELSTGLCSAYDILTDDDLSLELLGRVSVRAINLSYQQRSMIPEIDVP
jgi:hypothetical protein